MVEKKIKEIKEYSFDSGTFSLSYTTDRDTFIVCDTKTPSGMTSRHIFDLDQLDDLIEVLKSLKEELK